MYENAMLQPSEKVQGSEGCERLGFAVRARLAMIFLYTREDTGYGKQFYKKYWGFD